LGKEIAEDRRALLAFGDGSSGEFNAIGESLAGLSAGLTEVRIQATKLDSILQDHDEDRALSSAFELYKKSVDLAHGSIGLALSQEEQMEQMESRLLQDRRQFSQTAVMFRLLVLQIRTEAARIDEENRAIFVSVAEEIDRMARQMNATVETAFSQLEEIVKEAAAGREQLQNLKTDLNRSAQHSMQVLRTALEKIASGLKPCAAASSEISGLLAQTRSQTNDLVMSLQYQDIVRQQLEHVGQGFDDIALHLKPRGFRASIDLGYVHHAVRVQQIHLQGSRQSIDRAGRDIGRGCQALLETGAALVSGLAHLEKATDSVFRNSNVSELFKRETDNLVQIAGLSEETNRRISRLLARIEECVRVFSTDIRCHEFEVQLVALNAQIAAARVPNAGALVKLAEETANLSWHTASLTKAMTVQLGETMHRLQAIRMEATEVQQTVGREKAVIAADSIVVAAKLAALNQRIQHTSSEVTRNFGQAYRQMSDLLPTLTFPSLIASCYAPAEKLCERLLAVTAEFGSDEMGEEGSDRLAAHRGRYTMQQERDAHASAVDGTKSKTTSDHTVALDAVEIFDTNPDDLAAASESRARSTTLTPGALSMQTAATVVVPKQNMGDGVELF